MNELRFPSGKCRRDRRDCLLVGAIAILALPCAAEEKMSDVLTALTNTTITGYVNTSAQWDLASVGVLNLDFGADQILTGLWVARTNLAPTTIDGANHLTITAYSGDLPLGFLGIALESTTPMFWDTSPFLHLTGVTRYSIASAQSATEIGYFGAGDFQFSPVSIAEFCPCDGPWRNQGAYVQCVGAIVTALSEESALTRNQAKDLLKQAHTTDCGRNHLANTKE
jgi:hypothetical protein